MSRQYYYQSSNNFGAPTPRRLLRTSPERYSRFNGFNSREPAYSNWYDFNPRPRPRRITRRIYRILPPNDYRIYDTLNTGDRSLDYYEPSTLSTRSFPRRSTTPASYLYDRDNRFLPHPTYSRKHEGTCRCQRLEDDSDSDNGSLLSYDEDVDDESDLQSEDDDMFPIETNGCHCKKNQCKRPIIYYVPFHINSNESIPFTPMPETSRRLSHSSPTNHESIVLQSKPETTIQPVYTSPNDSIYLRSKPETSSHPIYTNPDNSVLVHSDHRRANESAVRHSDFDTSRHCLPKCQLNCNRKYCPKSSLEDSSEHSEFTLKYSTKDQSASKTDSVFFVKEPPEHTLSSTTTDMNDEPVREHKHKRHHQSPKLDSVETEKQVADHVYDSESYEKSTEKEETQNHHNSHQAETNEKPDEKKKTHGHPYFVLVDSTEFEGISNKKEETNDHHKLHFNSNHTENNKNLDNKEETPSYHKDKFNVLHVKTHKKSDEMDESPNHNKLSSFVEKKVKKGHNKTNGSPGNVLDSKNNTCGCIPDTKNSSKGTTSSRHKSKIPSAVQYNKPRDEHPEQHHHTSLVHKHDEYESSHK